MKKYIKYIVIVLLIIAAVMIYTKVKKNSSKPEWRTDKPSNGTIREVVTATGSLNPYVLVEVGSEVSGTIEKIYKDFNQPVRKGDLLAKLDTEILLTAIESARAEVNKATISRDEAQLEADISQELFTKDMTSEYEKKKDEYALEQAKQSLKSTQLRLQTAQKNLQNASIVSPIDGVIVARNVNEGQTVAASFNAPVLFTIANNLDKMQITANVDEADIGKIKVNMPVEFNVDAYAGQQFMGTVDQIRLKSTTEQNVVSYSVIINADNPGHKLLPGMTTNVSIIVQAKENVLRIPETATRFVPSREVWELFGLKWEDELISNARKKAMETAMAKLKQTNKPPTADSSAKAGPAPSGRPGRTGMRRPGGDSGSGGSRGMGMIWVLKNKVPELIVVRTGVSDGAFLELIGELDPNTEIIIGVNYKDPKQAPTNNIMQGPGMGPRF